MLIKKNAIIKKEKAQGGTGYLLIENLLNPEQLGDSCKLFGLLTLEPGCSVGKHKHVGTTDTYHILQGSGQCIDDDEQYPVKAGDTVFCPDGHAHGLINDGKSDLVFTALVLKA